jgi:hypothetical protein
VTLDFSGTSRKYAWGGAGAGWAGYGTDWNTNSTTAAITPAANTGAGGGGGRHTPSFNNSAGSGASGIVVVRYTPTIDSAWSKTSTSGNYASATTEVIPVATNAEWTVEAWVNPTSPAANTWYGILGQQNGPNNRYSIWMYNNNLHLTTPTTSTSLGANGGTTPPVLSYVIKSSGWTHIAWVMSTGVSSKLYIDGALVWQGDMARSANAGTLFTVGGTDQSDLEFPGHIDQVKVWGSQLTEAQIQTSMHTHGTFTGAPTLRVHYDFNEYIQGTLLDRSGNNRHLGLPGSSASTEFTSSAIVETLTPHSLQTVVKFNRSYLTSSGGWHRPTSTTKFKSLVVAGGGGGGAWVGGGGGAGGLLQNPELEIPESVVRVQVGQGGRGASHNGSSYTFEGVEQSGRSGQSSILGSKAVEEVPILEGR